MELLLGEEDDVLLEPYFEGVVDRNIHFHHVGEDGRFRIDHFEIQMKLRRLLYHQLILHDNVIMRMLLIHLDCYLFGEPQVIPIVPDLNRQCCNHIILYSYKLLIKGKQGFDFQ